MGIPQPNNDGTSPKGTYFLLEAARDRAAYDRLLVNTIDLSLPGNYIPDFPHNSTAKASAFFDSISSIADPLADALVAKHGPAYHLKVMDEDVDYLAEALNLKEIPAWVNQDAIRRGQLFFWRNLTLIFDILLHLSLASGFGVPRIDAVLLATGYLSDPKRSYRRLLETTQMSADAMTFDELAKVGGKGWRHVIKVRLLHAGVRLRIKKGKKTILPGAHESVEPINQADMNSTLLSFQAVLLLGLTRAGLRISHQDAQDYTDVWRFIGHLIGVEDSSNCCQWGVRCLHLHALQLRQEVQSFIPHLPRQQTPHSHDSAIVVGDISTTRQNLTPDEAEKLKTAARDLSMGVLTAVSENSPYGMAVVYHVALARWLAGDVVSNELGLPKTNWFHWLRVYVRFLIFRSIRSLYFIPVLGTRLVNRLPVLVKKMLVKEIERVSKDGKVAGK
ncbi:hypothetical protein BC829DRAFT_405286 [Chytridium lagenaria]|nr:hypothetical protein BC829DRAFT_405286 [Chytridium lagenaria]